MGPGVGRDLATILDWIRRQGYRPAPLQDYLPISLGGTALNQPAQHPSTH